MTGGRARADVEIPAVSRLWAGLDSDVDGTPRLVVEVDDLQVRFVLPDAQLTVDTAGAVNRLATAVQQWNQAVCQLATAQGVFPL